MHFYFSIFSFVFWMFFILFPSFFNLFFKSLKSLKSNLYGLSAPLLAAVVRNTASLPCAPLPCTGALPCTDASVLCTLAPLTCCGCSRCHVLRYQAVWSPPLFTACVSVTCVACACSWGWATHGLLIVISTGVPWVSCRDPPVCSRCPGSMASVAERQLVLCWVVLRCGVWWCVVHVVVWIVSSLRFVMCPLAPLLDMVTAVALSILRDTSHHSWLISLADTTDFRLWMLQLLLLINTSDSACCSFTRLNLTFGTAHRHSRFEDLQCFLQRLDFLLSGCCTVGVRDTRVNTSVTTPI